MEGEAGWVDGCKFLLRMADSNFCLEYEKTDLLKAEKEGRGQ